MPRCLGVLMSLPVVRRSPVPVGLITQRCLVLPALGERKPHKRHAASRSEFRNYACPHRVPLSLAAEKELEERRQMESGELLACHVRHKDVSIASCRAKYSFATQDGRSLKTSRKMHSLASRSIDRSIARCGFIKPGQYQHSTLESTSGAGINIRHWCQHPTLVGIRSALHAYFVGMYRKTTAPMMHMYRSHRVIAT